MIFAIFYSLNAELKLSCVVFLGLRRSLIDLVSVFLVR